jgi:hypothetical protein
MFRPLNDYPQGALRSLLKSHPLTGTEHRQQTSPLRTTHKKLMKVCCRIAKIAIYEDFN